MNFDPMLNVSQVSVENVNVTYEPNKINQQLLDQQPENYIQEVEEENEYYSGDIQEVEVTSPQEQTTNEKTLKEPKEKNKKIILLQYIIIGSMIGQFVISLIVFLISVFQLYYTKMFYFILMLPFLVCTLPIFYGIYLRSKNFILLFFLFQLVYSLLGFFILIGTIYNNYGIDKIAFYFFFFIFAIISQISSIRIFRINQKNKKNGTILPEIQPEVNLEDFEKQINEPEIQKYLDDSQFNNDTNQEKVQDENEKGNEEQFEIQEPQSSHFIVEHENKQNYDNELIELANMGFNEKEKNKILLVKHKGNIQNCISELI